MKKILAIIFAMVIVMMLTACSASAKRDLKSLGSEFSGGLSRTVTVYDYNGQEIKSWTGKFDVSESENEVYFDDQDGKRVIIHGGIVINEEH